MIDALAPTYDKAPSDEDGVARATIPADPQTHPANTRSGTGFFDAAVDAVLTGRITGELKRNGIPLWIEGAGWRPILCNEPNEYPVDCTDCGSGRAQVFWSDYAVQPGCQEAKAFEIVLRELITLGVERLPAEAMRVHLGKSLGGNLWSQVTAAIDASATAFGAADPMVPEEARGTCLQPEYAVAMLEYATGFTGQGTLLVPSYLLPVLSQRHALVRDGQQLRTIAGNRVITEGIGTHNTNDVLTLGATNIAMVGPVDYAMTAIQSDEETAPSGRGNDLATRHLAWGLTRTDMCAARRICAAIPSGTEKAEN